MVAVLSSGLLGDVADGNRLIETIQLPAALYLPHNNLWYLHTGGRRLNSTSSILTCWMLRVIWFMLSTVMTLNLFHQSIVGSGVWSIKFFIIKKARSDHLTSHRISSNKTGWCERTNRLTETASSQWKTSNISCSFQSSILRLLVRTSEVGEWILKLTNSSPTTNHLLQTK